MSNSFDREKLLIFLKKNPDKIPSMTQSLRDNIKFNYNLKVKTMSINELVFYFCGPHKTFSKKVIDKAKYGY